MEFYTNIRGPRRMNPANFNDPLSFPLTPTADQPYFLVLSKIPQLLHGVP